MSFSPHPIGVDPRVNGSLLTKMVASPYHRDHLEILMHGDLGIRQFRNPSLDPRGQCALTFTWNLVPGRNNSSGIKGVHGQA